MSRRDRQARKDASTIFLCLCAFVLALLLGALMNSLQLACGLAGLVVALSAAVMMAGSDVGEGE